MGEEKKGRFEELDEEDSKQSGTEWFETEEEIWKRSREDRSEEGGQQKKRRHGPPMTVCLSCHSHKLKCDKRRPCLHCVRRKRECIYQDDKEGERRLASASSSSSPDIANGVTNWYDGTADSRREERMKALAYWKHFKTVVQKHDSDWLDVFPMQVVPNTDFISQNWFDHLLSFFGPNKANGRRMISSLLERALQPSHYYWFDMYHRPTIRRQISREEERHRLNPAIAFSLIAIALRRRTGDETSTYGHGTGNVTLIPSEVLASPRGPDDLSERLREEAEKYLNQAILTADKATGSWLQIAQAATLLMQLELEVSPSYLHYLYLAAIFFRAPSLQLALDQEAQTSVGVRFQGGPLMKPPSEGGTKRSSITMEVAARLRLLPLWVGSRVGTAFPNIEFHQTHFKEIDVKEAYSFAPWPDEYLPQEETKDGYAYSLRARIIGLSILSTALGARFMPYGLNYADPPETLSKCLRILDDSEFILDLSREVIDLEENSYYRLSMVRLVTSVCHMHGVIIRRCNLAHSDSLRGLVTAVVRGEKVADGKNNRQPIKFASVALELWNDLMQVYSTELDTDHLTYTTSAGSAGNVRLHISRYQIDVLRLYVAATYQLRGGVINTLRLVGVESPMETDELVGKMTEMAEGLQERIARHTRLMEEAEQNQFGHNFTTYTNNLPLAHPYADYRPIASNTVAASGPAFISPSSLG